MTVFFLPKAAQFNLDCKEWLAQGSAREDGPRSVEALRARESSLQPPSELSPEKFQHMKVQASSMRGGKGLEVWGEALEKCQEAKKILEGVQVRCKEEREGGARVCGENGDPVSMDPPPKVLGKDPYFDGALRRTRNQERLLECNPKNPDTDRRGAREGLSCGADEEELGREGSYLASPQAVPQSGGQNPSKEPPESLPTPPVAHPSHPSWPKAKDAPETWGDLPAADWTCVTVARRGQRTRRNESAQYFQLSRHGSFSSEDTDSQNSTEESLSSSATLPMESIGPKNTSPQGRALGILYLEKHSNASLNNVASQ